MRPMRSSVAIALGLAACIMQVHAQVHEQTGDSAACRREPPDAQACEQAKAALEQATQRERLQAARAGDFWRLQQEVDQLRALRDQVPDQSKQARAALASLIQKTAASRDDFSRYAGQCKALNDSVDAYLGAAAAYRSAAATFTTAPPDRATAAAQASEQARSHLLSTQAEMSAAMGRCQVAQAQAEAGRAAQSDASDVLGHALGNTRVLGAQLQQAAREAGALNSSIDGPAAPGLAAGIAAVGELGVATSAWANGVAADGPSAVRNAIKATATASTWRPDVLVTARERQVIAEDAQAFWTLTGTSHARWCAGKAACLRAMEASNAEHGRNAESAARVAQEASAIALTALSHADAGAAAADPDHPSLRAAETALGQPLPTPSPALLLDESRKSLAAELQVEQDKLWALQRASAQARRLAYGEPNLASGGSAGPPLATVAPPPPPAIAPGAPIATGHAYRFVNGDKDGEAPAGYAAYTAVLLPFKAPASVSATLVDSYAQTLISVVGDTASGKAVEAEHLQARFNLFCVPNTRAAERNAVAPKADASLLDEYDYPYMEHLLLRANSGAALHGMASGLVGSGPYLFTTFGSDPAAGKVSDRFIFVDLSGVPSAYILDLVKEYKQRLLQPPGAEPLEEWKPGIAQRIVMNVDHLGGLIRQLKASPGLDVAKAGGSKSKQTFLSFLK